MKTLIKSCCCMTLLCMAMSCLASANKLTFSEVLQEILDDCLVDSKTPGATVLVSSPKLGVIVVTSGYADKKQRIKLTIHDNFRIASITKTFVAVAILQLVLQGKLNLDEKIANLLPVFIDINRIPNGKKLTLKELLQMRSGIPNYVEEESYLSFIQHNPKHHWKPEEAIELIYDKKPNFAPGKSYEYSNTNYLLLQVILEQFTQNKLAVILKKNIFEPLHLKDTYVEIQEKRKGGFYGLLTRGYEANGNKLRDVTDWEDGFGLGDGGMISTVQDLAVFIKALLQDKILLSPELMKEMLTFKGPEHYGLGIYREKNAGQWAYTHNGSSSGFSGQYFYFPQKKLTVVILTNHFDTDVVEPLINKILKAVDDE